MEHIQAISKLSSNNYQLWSHQSRLMLKAKKVWLAVDSEKPIKAPNNASAEEKEKRRREIEEFEEKDAIAASILLSTLEPGQAQQVLNLDEAKAIWLKLKQIHEGKTSARRVDLRLELSTIKKTENENIEKYLAKGQYIRDQLSQCQAKIENEEYFGLMLNGLPRNYNVIRLQMKASGLENLSEETFISGLKAQEDELRMIELDTKMEAACLTKYPKNNSNMNKNFKQNINSNGCYICGKTNHYAKNCYHRVDNRNNEERRYENKNIRRYPTYSNYRSEENQYKNRSNYRNEENQYKNRQRYMKREDKANTTTKTENINIKNEIKENVEAFALQIDENNVTNINKSDKWFIDSGATSHMTFNKADFTFLEEVETSYVKLPDGRTMRIHGKGIVRIKTVHENCKHMYIDILNVLWVPNLTEKLISVSTLEEKGYNVIFEGGKCKVLDKNDALLITGTRINGLYEMDISKTESNIQVASAYIIPDINRWHQRFGHQNMQTIRKMKNENIVNGLEFKTNNEENCISCILEKTTRKPFQSHKHVRTNKILELIHMDLCGPMPVRSLAGSRYMYVLVDDYSRKVFIYFLKNKFEALHKFKIFKAEIENQTNSKIKSIRSDNGGEFDNKEFKEFLEENGIIHEKTVAYTPQENGLAERNNRTIVEMTRCMLQDSKLPKKFWAEAAYYAVYLKNRMFSKTIQITPNEKFMNKKPNVEHIRVFGSKTYYWQAKQQRNSKLDATTNEGIFLGYDHLTKYLRVFCIKREKVIIVRDAKILEEEKGSDFLRKTNIKESSDTEFPIYIPMLTIQDKFQEYEKDIDQERNIYINENNENQIENVENNIEETKSDDNEEESTDTESTDPNFKPTLNSNINKTHLRRSERIKLKKDQHANKTEYFEHPETYKEALQSINKINWMKAIEDELHSHEENKTWEIIDRPKNKTTIDSKWIFRIKENPDGTINKFKARLVARGYNQQKGINYEETFSPVIRLNTLRTILAIATQENLELQQYDFTTAYLNAVLYDEIYMELPEGIEEKNRKDKVCKLLKGIYGLKQSALTWYSTIKNLLNKLGFQELYSASCVFQYRISETEYMILCLYVDDLLIAGTSKELINEVINKIKLKFKIKQIAEVNCILGIEIIRDREKGNLHITQKHYIDKILDKFNMKNCKGVSTPLEISEMKDYEYNKSDFIGLL